MIWHVWLTALLTGINGTYYVVYNKQEDVRFLLVHNQNVLVSSLSTLRGDFIFHSVKQAGGRLDGRAGGEVAFMVSATKTNTAGTEVTFAEKYCFPVLVNTPRCYRTSRHSFLLF